jgi:hypothetical protein
VTDGCKEAEPGTLGFRWGLTRVQVSSLGLQNQEGHVRADRLGEPEIVHDKALPATLPRHQPGSTSLVRVGVRLSAASTASARIARRRWGLAYRLARLLQIVTSRLDEAARFTSATVMLRWCAKVGD